MFFVETVVCTLIFLFAFTCVVAFIAKRRHERMHRASVAAMHVFVQQMGERKRECLLLKAGL